MQPDLRQFLAKYLSLVFATLMSVSFFAFLSIPYSLGGHPGEQAVAESAVPGQVSAAETVKQS